MNEDQAQIMIDLLIEISEKLTKMSDKIAHDKNYNTINDNLKEATSSLNDIKYNTNN